VSGGRVDVVAGVQWGDEGKGRVIDAMAGDYDIVARFAGGDNAGHTLVVGDRKVALRMTPSGALNERPKLFIGGGTVCSLETLSSEIASLRAIGVDVSRIAVSDRAQIVLPQHVALDRLAEAARGTGALGTTGRGIGPAYADRASRTGVRFADLSDPARFEAAIRTNLRSHAAELAAEPLDGDAIVHRSLELAEQLRTHVVDGVSFIHTALERGERVLAEGAQGSLLDVGYGSYPFVTSSQTIAGAVCAGLGVGPRTIDRIVGIAKAYCTRVGSGPFPSELHDETGERLRKAGAEFGTVTGRPRRCGWFDAVAARYASRINGLTEVFVTKLDVLSGFERIGVTSAYRGPGGPMEFGGDDPAQTEVEWFEGWAEPIDAVKRVGDLPAAAQRYVDRIAGAFGVPLLAVSVGPERSALARL
jgi:adenylosuccinate synthase